MRVLGLEMHNLLLFDVVFKKLIALSSSEKNKINQTTIWHQILYYVIFVMNDNILYDKWFTIDISWKNKM